MARTSKDEGEEQRRNKHLQGDHHRGPQKVGHGVPEDEKDERAGTPPDDAAGGRQKGGERGGERGR